MLLPIQRLKLDLMTAGLSVTPQAAAELSLHDPTRPLTLADYATTSGITLRLREDIWLNAPIRAHNPNFVSASPRNRLDHVDGRYIIRGEGEDLWEPAAPLPVPDYYNRRNASDEPYTDYAITHADRVRISPIQGCGIVCTFCDLPYRSGYRRRRIDGLVDSVGCALSDAALPARHVLISGGTPKAEDHGYLRTVFAAVARRFPACHIDIMMSPMEGLLDLHELREIGIHGLAVNLELWNRDLAKRLMRAKHDLGIDHYLDFIARAVAALGPGRVRSLILIGLEPPEDTLRAVLELASRGCDPVLSPFRPDPATPLRNHSVPSIALLEHVYLESLKIVARFPAVRLGPRCIPCQHNALAFPDGSNAFYWS